MLARTEQARIERLEQVLALVRKKAAAESRLAVESFVCAYYGQVDPEDLAEREPADLCGAALSHWNFARRRDPGSARVRAFNPGVPEHGWQSTHTIVEIVNDDMPFLVDTVTMEVNRHGLTLHLIVHPVIEASSYMYVEVDRIVDGQAREALAADLQRVLGDLRAAVEDWKKMLAKLREIVADLDRRPPPLGAAELAEGRAFLEWLADDHFTFLGYRCHDLVAREGSDALQVIGGSALGILREKRRAALSASFSQLSP
ncbi:MAG: NAD-glutamate dehydrogenase, partial [Betaproteobacteria bacterium]